MLFRPFMSFLLLLLTYLRANAGLVSPGTHRIPFPCIPVVDVYTTSCRSIWTVSSQVCCVLIVNQGVSQVNVPSLAQFILFFGLKFTLSEVSVVSPYINMSGFSRVIEPMECLYILREFTVMTYSL